MVSSSARVALARVALAPLLIWQGSRARRVARRLPEAAGPRQGCSVADLSQRSRGAASAQCAPDPAAAPRSMDRTTSGDAPLRLLILGDSSAAGVGVDHQQQALTGRLLDALHAQGVASVDWRLEAVSGWGARDIHAHLEALDPWAAQQVVVVVGVNDVTADSPVHQWIRWIDALDRLIVERTGAPARAYCGLPPMHAFALLPQPLRWYLGERARVFDRTLADWARGRCGAAHWPLETPDEAAALTPGAAREAGWIAVDGFHPGPRGYVHWAKRLALRMSRGR